MSILAFFVTVHCINEDYHSMKCHLRSTLLLLWQIPCMFYVHFRAALMPILQNTIQSAISDMVCGVSLSGGDLAVWFGVGIDTCQYMVFIFFIFFPDLESSMIGDD